MTTADITRETANIIRQQIETGVLMSLGARGFRHGNVAAVPGATPLPSLVFTATILPMTKNGTRGTAARTMTVTISHNAADYYDVHVTYPQRGDRYGIKPPTVHFEAEDVDASNLSRLLLALDYNGNTVLNPRLAA